MRKDLLVVGEVYHIFTRSIADFKIFNNDDEFSRMLGVIKYYQCEKPAVKFSRFITLEENMQNNIRKDLSSEKEKLVTIIAYCLMPTHLHLILKQLKQNGISIFMSNILNSYTRYFNTKHKRKGPLWEARFKSVLVEKDEYLSHLTRYIHLNPVTASLIDKPEDWFASSYREYIEKNAEKICQYDDVLQANPISYKQFVDNRISYQRELAKIKQYLFD
ncbi:MAG: transposase [Candidatus Omnitrophota bacterium]|nr:transposase [Candidatus Omnitrophota bacterium]